MEKITLLQDKDRVTCKVLSDEQIIKAAHEFFFCDKDAPEGKVWIYVCAMNK